MPASIYLYRAMYTLLNFPEPINFYRRKSPMLSDLRGASLVVVDTVSLNSLRLISRQSCLHFCVFSVSLVLRYGDLAISSNLDSLLTVASLMLLLYCDIFYWISAIDFFPRCSATAFTCVEGVKLCSLLAFARLL